MESADAHSAEWVLLSVHLPCRQGRPAGILLLDSRSDQLHVEIVGTLLDVQAEDFDELWPAITEDIRDKARNMGGKQLLDWLESLASHFLRISERKQILVYDFGEELNFLFKIHVSNELHYVIASNSSDA